MQDSKFPPSHANLSSSRSSSRGVLIASILSTNRTISNQMSSIPAIIALRTWITFLYRTPWLIAALACLIRAFTGRLCVIIRPLWYYSFDSLPAYCNLFGLIRRPIPGVLKKHVDGCWNREIKEWLGLLRWMGIRGSWSCCCVDRFPGSWRSTSMVVGIGK